MQELLALNCFLTKYVKAAVPFQNAPLTSARGTGSGFCLNLKDTAGVIFEIFVFGVVAVETRGSW